MSCCCNENKLSCCTFVVAPGGDIQAAIDALPPEGGCVCLKAGIHEITDSLRINNSYVKLTGESKGAVVVRRNGATLLTIEPSAPNQYVYDVVIDSIAFEFDNSQTQDSTHWFLIDLNRCDGVTIRECRISTTVLTDFADTFYAGLRIGRSYGFRLEHCSVEDVAFGVFIDTDSAELHIIRNSFKAEPETSSAVGGWIGVFAEDAFGPVYISGNTIRGYLSGIVLNTHYFNPQEKPHSMANGSVIEKNRIKRGPLEWDVTPYSFFAIDVAAQNCVIRDNSISFPSLGGIWVTGSRCRIENNHLSAPPNVNDQPLNITYGIVIGHYLNWLLSLSTTIEQNFESWLGHEIPDINTSEGVVRNNDIKGPLIGILASDNSGLQVFANRQSSCFFGVFITGVDAAGVSDNRIFDTGGAVLVHEGQNTKVTNNLIHSCEIGALASAQSNLEFSQNHIVDARSAGVLAVLLTDSAAYTENRMINCGYQSLISTTLSVSMFVFDVFGNLHIESNEVLDTGISPAGNYGGATTIGILAATTHCSILSNSVEFTDADVLDANLEHRAVWLIGQGLHYDIQLAHTHFSYGEGVAQISENRFIGPGLSALVQLDQTTDAAGFIRRFDRVTISDNYCLHFSTTPDNSKATIKLSGGKAIVIGNHIKATTNVHSVNFQGTPGVFLGNITQTGTTQFTAFPSPEGNYNL
jgi:hypothetical protein